MVDKKEKKKTSKHKRVTEDGRVWYYYPKKKKLGRKKKRGPKKKKKESWVRRVFEPWLFKIVLCQNKNEKKFIKRFHNAEEVEEYKGILLAKNNEVILPLKHSIDSKKNDKVYDSNYEYVVLKKREEIDETVFNLPNKFGKLVPHISSNEEWIVWDKFPCLIEETFWVFGYNNINDRKDIKWIYNYLIRENILSRYNFLRLFIYNNKLVILDDYSSIELIICKNITDCIRLYNTLQFEFCSKEKNILFSGRIKRNSDNFQSIFNLIKNKTKWSDKDIYRSSSRH